MGFKANWVSWGGHMELMPLLLAPQARMAIRTP